MQIRKGYVDREGMCRFGKKARRPGRGIHIGMYTSGMDVLGR